MRAFNVDEIDEWPSICSTYLKICSRQISSERAKKLLIVFAPTFERAELPELLLLVLLWQLIF